VIADNKLALNAGWDENLLNIEIGALQEMDLNLGLIGFDKDEPALLLSNPANTPGITEPDEAPPVLEHSGRFMDSRLASLALLRFDQSEGCRRLMDRQTADRVFADPPYNVNYSGKG
jgi:hypothetical protein